MLIVVVPPRSWFAESPTIVDSDGCHVVVVPRTAPSGSVVSAVAPRTVVRIVAKTASGARMEPELRAKNRSVGSSASMQKGSISAQPPDGIHSELRSAALFT